MDSMMINKAAAAVLVSGIAFFMAGRVGDLLVKPQELTKTAIAIDMGAGGAAPPPAVEAPLPVLLAAADPKAGQADFAAAGCVACHSVNEGGKAGVGPNLYGVVGAKEGGRPGFVYSAALSGKGGEWTFENLNTWITKPAAFAPGTKMSYAGLADAKKRSEILVYLRTLAATPMALPAVPAGAVAATTTSTTSTTGPAAPPAAPESFDTLLAKADVDQGKTATLKLGCVACHSFTEGGKNGLGPNLYGVVGGKQASHEGFVYSAALKAKDGIWTFDTLNTWLTKPAAYAPGTKMTYAGVADTATRANLVAYLRSLSANPAPLPTP